MNPPDNRLALLNSPARRLSMTIIGCVLIVDLAWLPFSALRIGAGNIAVFIALAAMFLLAGPMQRRYQFSEVIKNIAIEFYILLLFGAVGFIFSYLAIESGWAVRDEWLVTIDNSLGFDWRAYTSFFLQNNFLRAASLVLYVLSPLLVGFALFWLCVQRNFHRASELVVMVIIGGVLCVVISGILPSVGGAGYFPTDGDFYRGYRVIFDGAYKTTFFQLRNGAGMDVFLLHPFALIAFPSYHACLALLVIPVFWRTGLMGSLVIMLSVGSMFSLPVDGGHHMSDVLGGLLTGSAAFWIVRKYLQSPACR